MTAERPIHQCRRLSNEQYEISWVVKVPLPEFNGKVYRRIISKRFADEAGARRFCKKWNLDFEEVNYD